MRSGFFGRMMAGMVLIGVGLVFMLSQLGIIQSIDFGYIFSTYWPVFMIYFGLHSMIAASRFGAGAALWNMIVVLLGVFFLLRNLGLEGFTFDNMSKLIIPVIIILIGLSMIFRKSGRRPKQWDDSDDTPPPPSPLPPKPFGQSGLSDLPKTTAEAEAAEQAEARKRESMAEQWKRIEEKRDSIAERHQAREERKRERHEHRWQGAHSWKRHNQCKEGGKLNYANFIGDIHLGQEYWELTPLDVSHFIGDTVIDLTKATIPDGESRINVAAFIGDVKLYVPNDIDVEIRVATSVFLGDLRVMERRESGMFKNLTLESPGYREAGKRIFLNASMFIGDVVVQRVG